MQLLQNKPTDLTGARIKKILLSKKYRQFFFPALIAAVALSLSEFVDGIVVSNLLDTQALSIVNVCMPLMTLMAAIYLIPSVGGVVLYTQRRARCDFGGAATVFTVSVVTSAAAGLLCMGCGLLFTRGIAELLCPGLILGEELLPYIRLLVFSMPILIPVQVLLYFLAAAGNPKLSMALNVFANVLNLLLDYVYIRLFHMGVAGAAAATLTSFAAAGLLLLLFRKKYELRLVRFKGKDFRCLSGIIRKGIASSVLQIGLSVKYAFSNATAASVGGGSAIAAMSLFMQASSIISIAISGASDSVRPFLALLRTQHDYHGTGFILKKSLRFVGVAALAFVLVLEFFPGLLTGMYHVTSPEVLAAAFPALRIAGLCFLIRSTYILYTDYLSVLGLTAYATFISLFDSLVGIVAVGTVLTRLFGLTGLWATFPVVALLVFSVILIINLVLRKKHPDRYSNILLIEMDPPEVQTLDLAIEDHDEQVVYISKAAIAFCTQNGVPGRLATKIGLLAEEMAIYIRGHIQSHELLNLLLKKKGDTLSLCFRSIGAPYDLSAYTAEDIPENYQLLKALMPEHRYNYTMGLNNLQLEFYLGKAASSNAWKPEQED